MTRKQQPAARKKTPPPFLLIAGAAALLVLIAGVMLIARQPGLPPSTGEGARVAVEPEKIDFGQVKVEQQVTARFVVTNQGDDTLQILGQPQVRLVDGC